jgi:biopolymer transport protein ExbB/TolQ
MGILTLLFLIGLIITIRTWLKFSGGSLNVSETRRQLSYVKSLGVLAFVVGLFAQLLGLFSAFTAIEEMGRISPAMLAGGLKVSMITTIYGAIILIICLLSWMIMDARLKENLVEG